MILRFALLKAVGRRQQRALCDGFALYSHANLISTTVCLGSIIVISISIRVFSRSVTSPKRTCVRKNGTKGVYHKFILLNEVEVCHLFLPSISTYMYCIFTDENSIFLKNYF